MGEGVRRCILLLSENLRATNPGDTYMGYFVKASHYGEDLVGKRAVATDDIVVYCVTRD